MVQITRYPVLSHLRAEPSQYILRFSRGRLVEGGRGLSFWFLPLSAAISSVAAEDLEVPFLIRGRSRDFQEVNVQGSVTYRVKEYLRLAERVDFSIDLQTGLHRSNPLERIAGAVTSLAQQLSIDLLASSPLATLLAEGCERVRARLDEGFRREPGLAELGIDLVAVRVSSVQPSTEVEKALRMPMREAIQQDADEATFKRRAQAVEKERAIQENELQNKIELARRESTFIEQSGTNDRRRATDAADIERIAAESEARRREIAAHAEANAIRAIAEANVAGERARTEIYSELPSDRLMALAVQELAGKLTSIGEVTITPDHVGSMLQQLGLVTTRTQAAKGA
jgi:regulator of protease activity HflC (stomatin/prohibitin superfamily)